MRNRRHVLVEPDHFFYGGVTLADVPEIIEALATGRRVERLLLHEENQQRGLSGYPG